ncbi:MAG: hypothetical protein ABMB14_17090 [Myxococcota bacterium]
MIRTKTRLSALSETPKAKRFAEIDAKDLRRAVGGLRPTVSTGASTFNNDSWCDCD